MSKMGLRVGNCGLYDECSGKTGEPMWANLEHKHHTTTFKNLTVNRFQKGHKLQ